MLEINKIYCIDALEGSKKLDDNSVDLIITDPPWNVGKDYGVYKDKLKKGEYISFIEKLREEWSRVVKENKYAIILGSEILKDWWNIFPESKIIIVKLGAIVLTRKNNFHLQWKAILTNCQSNKFSTDLWEDIRWPGEGYFFNEPRYGHPAMTPLKLIVRLINLFTESGNLIIDPFMGVGTVAEGCKQENRNFIGFEINPQYIEIANKRISKVQVAMFD